MAWRIEETKTGVDIVIDGFTEGIAPDALSGMADMRQVNIDNAKKYIFGGYDITNSTVSGATLGVPCSRSTMYTSYGVGGGGASGSTGATRYAILDVGGQVFEASSFTGTWTFLSASNTTTSSSSKDSIAYWKGYLFKFRNDKIDYWDGSVWTSAWKTITGGVGHYSITPVNDKLYFCNGAYVGSISENTYGAFDPTSTATYTFNTTAFQLPGNDSAISLAALAAGSANSTITLLVGGVQNVLYPFSTTALSFNTPIYVGDNYIKCMVGVNQNAFVFTGNVTGRGRIFITNSVQAQEYFKIPDQITSNLILGGTTMNYDSPYFSFGDAIYHRNNLLFSFGAAKNGDGASITGVADVWAINLETKAFRSVSSLNSVSSTSAAYAGALISDQTNNTASGFTYIAGYANTTAGTNFIGRSSSASGTSQGLMLTDQIPVGTFYNKNTFRQVEVILQTPLASGENVILFPIIDGVTAPGNIPFSTVGEISYASPVNFQNAQTVQFRVSMTGNSQNSGVRVREIRIHGARP